MAELLNDTRSLRFELTFAGRESPRALGGRLICSAALEYFDQRDHQYWPFIRIPFLYLTQEAAASLYEGIAEVLRAGAPGFAWQSGEDPILGIQLGAGGNASEILIEVGVDLGAFLAESAGTPRRGGELALFRFASNPAAMVEFADDYKREWEESAAAVS